MVLECFRTNRLRGGARGGCGPFGLAAITLAKLRGASVIAVDPMPYRRQAAVRMGAEAGLLPDDSCLDEILERTNGLGADLVVECSGKSQAYKIGFSALKIGGSLVCIGEGARIEIGSSVLIHKHLSIVASLYSTMDDGRQVQEMILDGEIDAMSFVTHTFLLADLPTVFGNVVECKDDVLKSIVRIGQENGA